MLSEIAISECADPSLSAMAPPAPLAPLPGLLTQLQGPVVLLFNWDIDEVQAVEIAAVLRRNASLTALNLGGNRLGELGVMAIFPALIDAQQLTSLHMHRNQIGDGGAAILGEAIKTNTSLQELYLGDNQVADIGAEAMAAALSKSRLVKLKLMNNLIGDKGAEKLADALVQTQSLCELDLSSNQITGQGAARLQDAEAGHPSLRLTLQGPNKKPGKKLSQKPDVKLRRGEFLMEINTSQEKFGIHLQIDKSNKILKVSSIDGNGVVARWNAMATEPVKTGDHILQVNGETAIDKILEECRKQQMQQVVLKHAESVIKQNQRVKVCNQLQEAYRSCSSCSTGTTVQWFGSMMRWKVRLDNGTAMMCLSSDLEAIEEIEAIAPTEVNTGDLVHYSGDQGVVCGFGASSESDGGLPSCIQRVQVAFLKAGLLEVSTQDLAPVVLNNEYLVFLRKGSCSQLGLDVSPNEERLEEWNRYCSQLSVVKVGDQIVQVNQKVGEAKQLLDECKRKVELLLRIRRKNLA